MQAKRNRLDNKFLSGEFFGKLYCREIGVTPDESSVHASYADLGNCNSFMNIQYNVKGEYHSDMIEMIDVFNLIAKHALKLPREWKPTAH